MKMMANVLFIISFAIVTLLFPAAYSQTGNDSTTFANYLPTTVPNTIFLLEQGYINWPSSTVASGNPEQQAFTTSKQCPASFTPYVVIRLTKTRYIPGGSGNDYLMGFGACVNGLGTTSGANVCCSSNTSITAGTCSGPCYNVGYLVSRQYGTTSTSSNSGLYVGTTGTSTLNPGLYVGTNSASWVVGNTVPMTPMPSTGSMTGPTHDFGNVGGFYWDVYCYPPNIVPPTISGCSGGEASSTTPY